MKLIPSKATQAELRGEALFHGKAKCIECHSGSAFVDDYFHDLQVERFYVGRPEGPINVPAARHQGLAALSARRPLSDSP
jgi:cytochrome c peroxidase